MTSLLLIDDERDSLDTLEMVLSASGYQTQAVTSGEAALKILHTPEGDLPDLIIADIVMPVMTGLQLLDAVRVSPHLSNIPFLFISAFITPEIETQITSQDKTALLRKPFDVEKLSKAIRSIQAGP
jgi:CheY-like chemotaxis protein